ncbi:MAG: hypothetical protein ACK5O2_02460 [Microthrixaceae bacterium]
MAFSAHRSTWISGDGPSIAAAWVEPERLRLCRFGAFDRGGLPVDEAQHVIVDE